jgi:hypothetical protein
LHCGFSRSFTLSGLKRPPVLRRSPPVTSSLPFWRPIGAHCAWRNIDTQLHRKLRCHTRLAPRRILLCHLYDEFADVLRNSSPASLRLPFPKQLETLAMPASQRLGFDGDQGLFPIAEARPEDQPDTRRVVQSSRLDLSLLSRPVAFAGTGPPCSGLCASGTGDGRKEVRPRPDR